MEEKGEKVYKKEGNGQKGKRGRRRMNRTREGSRG